MTALYILYQLYESSIVIPLCSVAYESSAYVHKIDAHVYMCVCAANAGHRDDAILDTFAWDKVIGNGLVLSSVFCAHVHNTYCMHTP